jgi:predicted transglutaminase-like protease
MKYDKAYCVEINEYLTIYQARDLHFDELDDFDGNNVTFRCPNEDCRKEEDATLTTFNLTARKYKKTPRVA